jgi:hypothetical protein
MHDEVLTKEAREILPLFKQFEGFYLVGGTALALQIGHRVSVDFDFFSFKDYVDWYFMLSDKRVSLEEVISGAEKKFGADFNDRLFLGQLVSTEDVPPQKIDFLKEPVGREEIESTLKSAVSKFAERSQIS